MYVWLVCMCVSVWVCVLYVWMCERILSHLSSSIFSLRRQLLVEPIASKIIYWTIQHIKFHYLKEIKQKLFASNGKHCLLLVFQLPVVALMDSRTNLKLYDRYYYILESPVVGRSLLCGFYLASGEENDLGYCDWASEKDYSDNLLQVVLTCCSRNCTATLFDGVSIIALNLLQQHVEYIGYGLILLGRRL